MPDRFHGWSSWGSGTLRRRRRLQRRGQGRFQGGRETQMVVPVQRVNHARPIRAASLGDETLTGAPHIQGTCFD